MRRLPLLLFAAALLVVVFAMLWFDPSPSEERRPDDRPDPVESPEPVVPVEDAPHVPAPPEHLPRSLRDSLELGVKWLAGCQAEDGSWSSEHDDESKPAVTGLVLLAFLGAGETHKHGSHKKSVKIGLRFLKRQQRADGGFGPYKRSDYAANDSIATLAMCEAYGMTGSPLFKQSAQLGVDYVVKRGISRIWDLLVIKSARTGGLRVSETWDRDAIRWLDSVTNEETGVASWPSGGMLPHSGVAQTGAAAWGRILTGTKPEGEAVVRAMDFVAASRPADHVRDPGFVYFSSLVAFHRWHRKKAWRTWVRTVLAPAGEAQVLGGSWDPDEDSPRLLGRVGTTALSLMAQEIRTWYPGVFRPR